MNKYVIFLLSFLFIHKGFAEEFWAHVSYVIDGDTFVTEEGKHVRLLGINTPEIGRKGTPHQPLAVEAKLRLTELINKKDVLLTTLPSRTHDKYGRVLAFIKDNSGEHINKKMLEDGLAHVYTFPDTPFDASTFFKAEHSARIQKKGLWNLPRWQIKETSDPISKKSIGQFNITEGTVLNTKTVKNKIYLNFGKDWRTDFTVEIKKKHWNNFTEYNINPHTDYKGKTLRIRGFLKPVNGILVTATHPAQLEIIDKK